MKMRNFVSIYLHDVSALNNVDLKKGNHQCSSAGYNAIISTTAHPTINLENV